MNGLKLPPWLTAPGGASLVAPMIIIIMLAMMMLPLPAFVLDIFFSFNIALAIIVLLTSLYTVKPLDFMVFPTVLLVSTMLRLSLNVASTRVVLTEGHTGPDAQANISHVQRNILHIGPRTLQHLFCTKLQQIPHGKSLHRYARRQDHGQP